MMEDFFEIPGGPAERGAARVAEAAEEVSAPRAFVDTSLIVDTHAHYDDHAFDEDRDELLAGLKSQGVGTVINVGASWRGCAEAVRLSRKWDFIFAAVGVHPDETGCLDEEKMCQLAAWTSQEKVIAIGEIGLDYHNDVEPREFQKEWFIRQMELANETELPIIVHSRDAAQDTWDIVSAHAGRRKGVIHAFSASAEMARQYIDMGFYIGVGGVVTFKNGRRLKEVVADVPIGSILLETDAPYLSPVPFRGKRNQSGNLIYVVQMIAQLKGITEEEVIEATGHNARTLFGI